MASSPNIFPLLHWYQCTCLDRVIITFKKSASSGLKRRYCGSWYAFQPWLALSKRFADDCSPSSLASILDILCTVMLDNSFTYTLIIMVQLLSSVLHGATASGGDVHIDFQSKERGQCG